MPKRHEARLIRLLAPGLHCLEHLDRAHREARQHGEDVGSQLAEHARQHLRVHVVVAVRRVVAEERPPPGEILLAIGDGGEKLRARDVQLELLRIPHAAMRRLRPRAAPTARPCFGGRNPLEHALRHRQLHKGAVGIGQRVIPRDEPVLRRVRAVPRRVHRRRPLHCRARRCRLGRGSRA